MSRNLNLVLPHKKIEGWFFPGCKQELDNDFEMELPELNHLTHYSTSIIIIVVLEVLKEVVSLATVHFSQASLETRIPEEEM